MENENDKIFPGKEEDEKIHLFLRRHPLSFLGFGLIILVMIILPIIILSILISSDFLILNNPELDNRIIIILSSAYFLFCLGVFFVGWANYYLDVFIVTDRKVIDVNQEGLFSRSLSSTDLVDVEDVQANVKGLLCTFFNYGDVFVQTAGDAQNINFRNVSNPYVLARKIMDFHQEAVRLENREKQGVSKSSAPEAESIQSPVDVPLNKEQPREYSKPKKKKKPVVEKKTEPKIKLEEVEEMVEEIKPKKKKKDQKIDRNELEQGGEIKLQDKD